MGIEKIGCADECSVLPVENNELMNYDKPEAS